MFKRVKTGVIGCGAISRVYLDTMMHRFGGVLEVVGCSSQGGASARERAAQYGIRAMTNEELLGDREIELVVILTPAASHAALIGRALERGKHVYAEKPLATDAGEARRLAALAEARGLRLCCAPDTLLSAGIQTARAALEAGAIGAVTSCALSMNRDYGNFYERLPFLLQPGAGGGADLGPYLLATAVYLLGPVVRVAGLADISRPERMDSGGRPYRVAIDNRFLALLRFARGIPGTLHLNCDSGGPEVPEILLYGTRGVLRIEAPNQFCRRVWVARSGETEFQPLPLVPGYTELLRGLGVAEQAAALRAGRRPLLDGAMAAHVAEIIQGIYESAGTGAFVDLAPRLPAQAGAPFTPELVSDVIAQGGVNPCQDP